jgi:hypothetical protein
MSGLLCPGSCATVNDEIKSNITLKDIKRSSAGEKGKNHLKTIFN